MSENETKIGEKWIISNILKGHKNSICTLAFNYFRNIFATGASDGKIYLWCIKSFKNLSVFNDHFGSIQSMVFDEKTDCLFSGGDNFQINQWDIQTNSIVRKYSGHVSSIIKIIKNPILNIIISGSRDNTIRLWDFRLKNEIKSLKGHKYDVTSLLSNIESPHLISGSLDDTLCFWDLVSNKNLLVLKNKDNGIKEICHLRNNEIFSVLSSQYINFYRKDGKIIKKITCNYTSNECFTIGHNNNIVISCSNGFIKYTYFYIRNSWLFFKPFNSKFVGKKEQKKKAIGFSKKENQLILVGTDKNIVVFSKKWFLFK
nr:pleiotropic regulatory locus1-like protein [Cryptomonas curvata]